MPTDMTTLYATLGVSLDPVLALYKTEARVNRYLRATLGDKAFGLLDQAMGAQNWEEAFKQAHTVKGMCQNLCLGTFTDNVSSLVECLRGGEPDAGEAARLYAPVRETYAELCRLTEASA